MIDIFEYNFRRIFFLVNKKLINNYKKKIPFAFFIASLFYMCTENQRTRPVFPFTAIVGQEKLKLALILNVIDPKIGGVLAIGDRGTGKTTTVRALLDLLPDIEVVCDDICQSHPKKAELISFQIREKMLKKEPIIAKYQKTPIVELPLSATEDRLSGTIDVQNVIKDGVKRFEPGLLAKANRGILYVDEVNLLEDNLVDILLDSAASGWNTVEREGISISHPSRFILIGSGNPEEGELRPQLIDRFGMYTEVKTPIEPKLRRQIVAQRNAFEVDPSEFRKTFKKSQSLLRQKILDAQEKINQVQINKKEQFRISQKCVVEDVDGLRGDIVTTRAACAYTAYQDKSVVSKDDVDIVFNLCLEHRRRKSPLNAFKLLEDILFSIQG